MYSLFVEEENKTLFDLFLQENISHKSELIDIIKRLNTIGKKTGANEKFFKHNEGKPGDGICALYDMPDSNLRLYCIRYGSVLIILGGGGVKPKTIRSLQEDEKLKQENYLLRNISEQIARRIKEHTIEYDNDGYDFDGDLTFEDI